MAAKGRSHPHDNHPATNPVQSPIPPNANQKPRTHLKPSVLAFMAPRTPPHFAGCHVLHLASHNFFNHFSKINQKLRLTFMSSVRKIVFTMKTHTLVFALLGLGSSFLFADCLPGTSPTKPSGDSCSITINGETCYKSCPGKTCTWLTNSRGVLIGVDCK